MKKKYMAFGLPVAALATLGAAAGVAAYGAGDDPALPGVFASADAGSAVDEAFTLLQQESDEEGDATAPEDRIDDFIQRLAGALGIDEQTLRDAIGETTLEMLEEGVASGEIPEELADAIRDRVADGDLAGPFFGGRGFGHGFGHGFPGGAIHEGRFGFAFAFGGAGGVDSEDIAGFLGITEDELGDALADGSTLGEVAEANGKTTDELKQFITDTITEAVNAAVADGDLTQEQADRTLEKLGEHIDGIIDGSFGPRGPFGGMHPPFPSPFGPDGEERESDGSADDGEASVPTA
ncbi:MAG TPA: hypothetical protein VFK32_03490 [Tepidiformaceae bacterium]|nr:hypothetical protein [Tepidiformaceae bacterium]